MLINVLPTDDVKTSENLQIKKKKMLHRLTFIDMVE